MVKAISMRKRFVLREFWRYFFIILTPLLLVEPVILYNVYQEINEGIVSENRRLPNQLENILEEMLQNVNSINSYFSQSSQMGYMAKSILRKSTLNADALDSINAVSQYLQNVQNTDSAIHSIYVYYDNDYGRFFNSRSGICKMQGFYDNSWYGEYLNSREDIWLGRHSVQEYDFTEKIPVISVYRKLYSGTGDGSFDGLVVVNYKTDVLENKMDALALYQNQVIAFLNRSGEVLLQSKEAETGELFHEPEASWLWDLSDVSEENTYQTFQMESGREKYEISVMDSACQNQIVYVSMVPFGEIYGQALLFSQIIGLSLLAALFLSIGLAWTSARRDVKQLNEVITLLNHEVKPEEIKSIHKSDKENMYDYILFNVLQLFMEQDYMKMQYSERKYRMEMLSLQVLQHQINPHFMNNTLNSIYWEAIRLTGSSNVCSDMLEKLSVIMKYAMESSVKEVIVQEEMSYVDTYLSIQSTTRGKEFKMKWDVEPEVLEGKIPKMLLQPLVENAVNHGIRKKQLQGNMKCRIRRVGEYLHFCILDTGMGVPKEKEAEIQKRLKEGGEAEHHVGLYNTNLRLVLRYGEESGISFRSKYGMGTVLKFKIPYIT